MVEPVSATRSVSTTGGLVVGGSVVGGSVVGGSVVGGSVVGGGEVVTVGPVQRMTCELSTSVAVH